MLERLLSWRWWRRNPNNGDFSLRESLEEAIEEHEEGEAPISADERLMLLNVLALDERSVNDVMVPRADIVAVNIDLSFADLVRAFNEASHSRLPLFRGSLDHVVGMIHIKDVLKRLAVRGEEQALPGLDEIKRQTLFVPPSMPVVDLLRKMRSTHIHLAMVIDEYGGTDGLVTIEDLVEEIVGEIEDEHDVGEEPRVAPRADGRYDADARAPVEALEAYLDIDLLPEERDEDIDTLGGLVVSLVGRVPDRGEVITHSAGIEFEVVDADPRRLKRLRISHVERRSGAGS